MAFRIDRFDADKFTDGEWADIMGGRFKIARMNNPAYRDAKRRLDREYLKRHGEELTADLEDEKEAKLIAEGLLRDWSDITAEDENGNEVPVPYSVENVATLLRNRPDVIPEIARKAVDLERFDREEIESQAGKPRTSSAGVTSGSKKASKRHTESTDE